MASSVRGGGAETLTVSYQRLTQTLADAMATKVGARGSSVEQVCVTRVPLPAEGLGPGQRRLRLKDKPGAATKARRWRPSPGPGAGGRRLRQAWDTAESDGADAREALGSVLHFKRCLCHEEASWQERGHGRGLGGIHGALGCTAGETRDLVGQLGRTGTQVSGRALFQMLLGKGSTFQPMDFE